MMSNAIGGAGKHPCCRNRYDRHRDDDVERGGGRRLAQQNSCHQADRRDNARAEAERFQSKGVSRRSEIDVFSVNGLVAFLLGTSANFVHRGADFDIGACGVATLFIFVGYGKAPTQAR